MSFQVCIKTDKSLQELATVMRDLLSLPPFKLDYLAEEPYCQFETLGMLILLRQVSEEDRDSEVIDYTYSFDLQLAFTEHELDVDETEYRLQPYYAQLLAFQLNLETACFEKKKIGQHWQIRYCHYVKNPHWNENILYGEQGWTPAVKMTAPGPWRSVHPLFS